MDDTISVQASTQSRVGDDWCQQQLLKRVNFLSGSFVNGSPGGGAHEFYTFKKLLLTPIITHPRLGGSLNRNCIVHVPDPFSRPHVKEKSGLATRD